MIDLSIALIIIFAYILSLCQIIEYVTIRLDVPNIRQRPYYSDGRERLIPT